jgi:hypothetical protein
MQYKFVIGSVLATTLAVILLLVVYSILLFPVLYGPQFISLEDQSFAVVVPKTFSTFATTERLSDENEVSPMLRASDYEADKLPVIDAAIELDDSFYGPGIPFAESVKTWRL